MRIANGERRILVHAFITISFVSFYLNWVYVCVCEFSAQRSHMHTHNVFVNMNLFLRIRSLEKLYKNAAFYAVNFYWQINCYTQKVLRTEWAPAYYSMYLVFSSM